MNKLARFLILLALMVLSAPLFAEEVTGTPNEIFRPISKRLVQKIVDGNVKKIGALDLVKLLRDLETVEWRTFDLGFLSGSGGKRQTSIYIVKDRMVVVNMLSLQNMVGQPVPLLHWALHEALGALGYEDEVYNLTTALNFVATGPVTDIAQRKEFIEPGLANITIRTTDRVYSREGGTTIVGGGGDAPIIELKAMVLERFMTWIDINHPEISATKKKRAFQRLVSFSMEFDLQANNYSDVSFVIRDNTLWISQLANLQPERMLNEEYVDSVLVALAPSLLR